MMDFETRLARGSSHLIQPQTSIQLWKHDSLGLVTGLYTERILWTGWSFWVHSCGFMAYVCPQTSIYWKSDWWGVPTAGNGKTIIWWDVSWLDTLNQCWCIYNYTKVLQPLRLFKLHWTHPLHWPTSTSISMNPRSCSIGICCIHLSSNLVNNVLAHWETSTNGLTMAPNNQQWTSCSTF